MDTDGRQIIANMLFFITCIILFFNSRFNILNAYIICNNTLISNLSNLLTDEGYCIENKSKGIYLIYPALYGERKCD